MLQVSGPHLLTLKLEKIKSNRSEEMTLPWITAPDVAPSHIVLLTLCSASK